MGTKHTSLTPLMSKAEAKRRAYKYQQGNQWVVVSVDEDGRCWEHSPMDYWSACDHVRRMRVNIRFGDKHNPSHYNLDGEKE